MSSHGVLWSSLGFIIFPVSNQRTIANPIALPLLHKGVLIPPCWGKWFQFIYYSCNLIVSIMFSQRSKRGQKRTLFQNPPYSTSEQSRVRDNSWYVFCWTQFPSIFLNKAYNWFVWVLIYQNGHEEAQEELSKKAKFFFTTAVQNWDAEFYVKVDDNIGLDLGRAPIISLFMYWN